MSKKALTFRERVIIIHCIKKYYEEKYNKNDYEMFNNLFDDIMNINKYKYLNSFAYIDLHFFNNCLNIYIKNSKFIKKNYEKYLIKNLLLKIESCILEYEKQ